MLPVLMTKPVPVIPAAVKDLVMFKLPAKEEEPVPRVKRLPPTEA